MIDEKSHGVIKIKNIINNGYDITQMGCVDLSFAVATSYFNISNYYLYGLFYSLYKNWGYKDFLFTDVLKMIGYESTEVVCHDFDKLLYWIKKSIDAERPAVFLLHYCDLFYNEYYNEEVDIYHGIPITGYNYDKGTVRLKELSSCFFEEDQGKGKLVSDITLTKAMLKEIWEKSNLRFNKLEEEYRYKLYVINNNKPEICDIYSRFLSEVNISFENNKLGALMEKFNSIRSDTSNIESFVKWSRKNFLGPIVVLFTALEQLYLENKEKFTDSHDILKELSDIKNIVINNRHVILSKLQLCLIKGIDLDPKFIFERFEMLKRDDASLKNALVKLLDI